MQNCNKQIDLTYLEQLCEFSNNIGLRELKIHPQQLLELIKAARHLKLYTEVCDPENINVSTTVDELLLNFKF